MANYRNPVRPLMSLVLTIVLLTPGLSDAGDYFERGKTRVSISAGTSTAFNNTYFQLGIGAGYFVMDGLELGLDARSWLGGEFSVHEVAPSITYIVTHLGGFQPYAGVLYRRTFIGGRDDMSAYGARGGILLEYSQNLLLRAGVVGIRHQNCDQTIYSECTEVYPEVSVGFYF